MNFKSPLAPVAILALVALLGQSFLVFGAPPAAETASRRTLVVEAVYPGASAQVVAETVATPIELQINGVERLKRMVSRCTDDGRYILVLSFDPAADLDVTQVVVQNRISLALPVVPTEVQRGGISVRKLSTGAYMVVVLTSPDASRDTLHLGNFATIQIKDELARLAGVGGVAILGGAETEVRVTIDRDKLAALNLTPDDVVKALREHKPGAANEPAAKGTTPVQIKLDALGKLADTEALARVVLKTTAGSVVYLRDVANVELGRAWSSGDAAFDGRPAVALVVSVTPAAKLGDVSAGVRERMGRLKAAFPPGLDYVLALDLSAPQRYLLAEPVVPAGASAERSQQVRTRYAEILRQTEGMRHVLSLPENPFARFRGGPCVVAMFGDQAKPSDWERIRETVRARFAREERSADPRLRDLAGQGGVWPVGYLIELALCGPDFQSVREFGKALASRLSQTGRVSDITAGVGTASRLEVEVDRQKVAALGLSLADIRETLRLVVGPSDVGEFDTFGRSAHLRVRLDPGQRNEAADLSRLKVRNTSGQMVPLGTVVQLRHVDAPVSVDRVDLRPASLISANPSAGVSLVEARWLCETLAERVRADLRLPADYRLVWLQELPAPKPIPGELKTVVEAPPEVTVARPVSREVADYEEFVGRVEAAESVELRARVTGYLVKTLAREGGPVKKGDLLFEIDSRPYQAQLDQARAEVEHGKAKMRLTDATRARLQAAMAGRAELDEATAAVDEAKSRLAVAEAVFAQRRLDLDYCRVTAPIDGIIGRNHVTAGNLVTQDKTLLNTIVGQGRMFVYFDVDERTYLNLRRAIQEGKIKAPKAAELPVAVGLSHEEGFPHEGKLDFVDNRIDPHTGALKLRAVLPDPAGMLRPGLFARVSLTLGEPRPALLVPEAAIGSDTGRKYVYVIEDGNKVASRAVTLGSKQGGLRVVATGLRLDDRVIVDGPERVRPGQTVKPTAGLR